MARYTTARSTVPLRTGTAVHVLPCAVVYSSIGKVFSLLFFCDRELDFFNGREQTQEHTITSVDSTQETCPTIALTVVHHARCVRLPTRSTSYCKSYMSLSYLP